MTVAAALGRMSEDLEQRNRAASFRRYTRMVFQRAAGLQPDVSRANDSIKKIWEHDVRSLMLHEKSSVTPLSTIGAAALAEYRALDAAFGATLAGSGSIFDRVLAAGAMRVPLGLNRVTILTSAGSGSTIAEASAKPFTQMSLDFGNMSPTNVVANVVLSAELARFSTPAAEAIFDQALRVNLITATDAAFLTLVLAETTPTASAGPTYANWLTDEAALFNAVDVAAGSSVFLAMSKAKALAYMALLTTAGAPAFPGLSVTGGDMGHGIEAVVSEAVPASRVLMIIPDRLAVASDPIEIRKSTQSTISMNTAPDSPETASTIMVSMFQQNLINMLAERFFSVLVRDRGAASLSY